MGEASFITDIMRDFAVSAQPSEPQPTAAAAPVWPVARSMFRRFDWLVVGLISLFFGFISLFGQVGNLHSDVS
jgi:hypothetical protein